MRGLLRDFVFFTLILLSSRGALGGHGGVDEEKIVSNELVLAPGVDGFLSSWMVANPVVVPKHSDPLAFEFVPQGEKLHTRLGRSFQKAVKPGRLLALSGTLRVDAPFDGFVSLGCNGAFSVRVDGEERFKSSAQSRFASPDTMLVPLKLAAGVHRVSVRIYKTYKTRATLFFRLLERDFLPTARVRMVLRTTGDGPVALSALGTVTVHRQLLPDKGAVVVDVWLTFRGGRPVLSPRNFVLTRVDTQTELARGILALDHPRKARFLLGRLRFRVSDRFSDDVSEQVPKTGLIQFEGEPPFRKALFPNRELAVQWMTLWTRLHALGQSRRHLWPDSTMDSVTYTVGRARRQLETGDEDTSFIAGLLSNADKWIGSLEAGRDPFMGLHNQLVTMAYRSHLDNSLQPYTLYVPSGWRPEGSRRYGLIVALHGLNGFPGKTITALFGHPLAEGETGQARARRPGKVGRAPFFVVAPTGFGNSGYQTLGEQDVLKVIDEVVNRYGIDKTRITITGGSMGGTGAAGLALRNPGLFAAAVPLCGYHDKHLFRELRGVQLDDVDEAVVNWRSNIRWAENGLGLPLYAAHGTRDFPLPSKALVNRFRLLGYKATLKLWDAGHNVWDQQWADGWMFRYAAPKKAHPHARRVVLRSPSLRHAQNRWLSVDRVKRCGSWFDVAANWDGTNELVVTTENVSAMTIKNDATLSGNRAVSLVIDGTSVTLPASMSKWHLVDEEDGWNLVQRPVVPVGKNGELFGPMWDAENQPLLFVYGTRRSEEVLLDRMVAVRLARGRAGLKVNWPVVADVEVTGEMKKKYSLVLVGTPDGNQILHDLNHRLPIFVDGGGVVVGKKRFEGKTVAASFIAPNPDEPTRYVVVHTGISPQAVYNATRLPRLLPDYVVYDATRWSRSGGQVLGPDRPVLAKGFFDCGWKP